MKKNNKTYFLSSIIIIIMIMRLSGVVVGNTSLCNPELYSDNDILEFALNLQYLSAELFMCGVTGKGIDAYDPSLAARGPPPVGCQKANLDPKLRDNIQEFAYQETSQIKDNKREIVGQSDPRPQLDISSKLAANFAEQAIGHPLNPPFDPYKNSLNFVLTVSPLTSIGLAGLVGAAPALASSKHRSFATKLAAMEAGQNAYMRAYLNERANQKVVPYDITVAEFTNRTAEFLNRLGKCGPKDEGVVVPRSLGAENRTESNVLAADVNSLPFTRTIKELLRITYGTGDESKPGGFFPNGANGKIARSFIR